VYEYSHRPGHRIRYWDDAAFREAFGPAFTILTLTEATELESVTQPVSCRLTVMVGRKKADSPRPERASPDRVGVPTEAAR
jgi:hypothetical protein